MKVVAVVGISGVGKSTFLKTLNQGAKFKHLQASALIKSEMTRLNNCDVSSEDLRLGQIIDNQKLLISGFHRFTQGVGDLVVFDGHTIIDGPSGVMEIPSQVFQALSISHMVFVYDEAEKILERRKADETRVRPERSVGEIKEQQARAILVAISVTQKLGIPLTLLTISENKFLPALLGILSKFPS